MESRGIELLPTAPPTGRSKIVSFWARTVGIPLIIVLQLTFLVIFAFRVKLELDLRSLSTSVGEKEAVLAQSADFEETFRRTQLKLETVTEVRQKLCYSCTVRTLNEIKPAVVTITNLSIEDEKLALVAETPPGTSFGLFIANIVKEEGIREAAVTSGRVNRLGNFVFTIELALNRESLR